MQTCKPTGKAVVPRAGTSLLPFQDFPHRNIFEALPADAFSSLFWPLQRYLMKNLTEFCTLLATPLHTSPCHYHLNIQTTLQIHCAGFCGFPVLSVLSRPTQICCSQAGELCQQHPCSHPWLSLTSCLLRLFTSRRSPETLVRIKTPQRL